MSTSNQLGAVRAAVHGERSELLFYTLALKNSSTHCTINTAINAILLLALLSSTSILLLLPLPATVNWRTPETREPQSHAVPQHLCLRVSTRREAGWVGKERWYTVHRVSVRV